MDRLFLIALALITGVYCINNSIIEKQCIDCLESNISAVFIKTIWFATAPFEYKCINTEDRISNYTLILDIACTSEDCLNFSCKKSKKLWHPLDSFCNSTNPQPQGFSHTTTFCIETVEIITVLAIVIVLIVKGKACINILIKVYNQLFYCKRSLLPLSSLHIALACCCCVLEINIYKTIKNV
jgi:hypothetical protein